MSEPSNRDVVAAVFRPDDERLTSAVDLLEALGATPVADPMLEIQPTEALPRSDADYVILTSKTGVELAAGTWREEDRPRWEPGPTTIVAIGPSTAESLGDHGYEVDLVPEEYSSEGLVDLLENDVAGTRVEVARSDHGSQVLLDGLEAAGAYLHETILYRLDRPRGAGESAELAASGKLDAALFTSSLTVAHFLDAAEARGIRKAAIAGLNDAVVGAIGFLTQDTAESAGIEVDVVPSEAAFDALATEVVELAAPSYHD